MNDRQTTPAFGAHARTGRFEDMLKRKCDALGLWWKGLDLANQFVIAAAAVVGLGMAHLGWWAGSRVEIGVIEHAAASAALHLNNFVEPYLQGLARGEPLTPSSEQSLSALIAHTGMDQSIVGLTVWGAGGKVIYSTHNDAMRAQSPAPPQVDKAWAGSVENSFGYADRSGAAAPVLKIFAPMHVTKSSRVIAVVELVEDGQKLATDLRHMRYLTAGAFGLLSLIMLASLFGIVRRGSQTITEQKHALTGRVDALSQLLSQNEDLQRRVIEANRRSVDINDRFVRRIGAELHDGPVQLIALSLLRLEALRRPGKAADQRNVSDDIDAVEVALRDALKEIRDLCSGLALPKLEGVSIGQVIEFAVMNHERRSRTKVKTELADNLSIKATPLLLTCAYRFTQEGLNNAVRHAGGKEQSVLAQFIGDELRIEVADEGPGFADSIETSALRGLGLSGLRDRIESLGGILQIQSREPLGIRLIATFKLNDLAASTEHANGNEAS